MYYSYAKLVQGLSKFAQNWDIFICNFVVIVKECEAQLYQIYCEKQTMYGQKEFGQFLDKMEHSNDVLHHVWVLDQSTRLEYVAFKFYGCIYMQYKRCIIIGALS
jgi:hypothetical protein